MPPKRNRFSYWRRRRLPLIHGILGRDQLDQDSIPYKYDYHPLKLKEEAHKENEDGEASSAGGPSLCAACGDSVLGSSYTCGAKPEDECSEFFLHEKCAELPVKINHPIHGKHPLILVSFRDYSCDVCGNNRAGLLSYTCWACNFDVDIQCASNLSNIKYAEHSTHPHILIFQEEQEKENAVFCDGCREPVVGPSYSCPISCSYTLHKSCVELPLEMQHPVHTEHPLMLSRDTQREFRCDGCNQDCSLRFTYSCFQCDFNLHLKCANSDQKDLMKHYTHEHALMLKEEQEEEFIGPLVVCDGCQDPVIGPRYTCINTIRRHKCGFNLHKSCAELPGEIQHPLHRKHPLFLPNVIQDIRVRCICNACNQVCRFRYSCSICDFNLDLKCASKWQNIIGNDSHKHQFTVLPKELADLRISCNVCGEYWRGSVYYMCSICQLLVHKECASFPRARHIKIPGHQHHLKLTWFVEDIYPKEDQLLCKVCSKSIVKCGAVYCCHECCGYVAHATCAMADSDTTYNVEYRRRIKHFSHEHELRAISYRDYIRLFKSIEDGNKIITCASCIQPITITTSITAENSMYFCPSKMSCHFFLHKICAEFQRKMFLPLLHSHPFTLLPRAPSFDGVFRCDMCGVFSQDFTYGCEECALPNSSGKTGFYLDLECSIYWENKALKHDSHVHRLLLDIEWDDVKCSGCGHCLSSIFCFSCKRCNFYLCIPCIKLPLTATHRYDDHPLRLTYASVNNELGEYYCEICEGTRDPNHWFYYCNDCDFDCHPHCILGRYPQVKLGSIYEHDAHDQHLVELVDKSKSPIPNDKRDNILPCEKCKQLCLGLVFECKMCNINIHREGCCPATDLASSSKSPDKS